jgi:hypothetical protein
MEGEMVMEGEIDMQGEMEMECEGEMEGEIGSDEIKVGRIAEKRREVVPRYW